MSIQAHQARPIRSRGKLLLHRSSIARGLFLGILTCATLGGSSPGAVAQRPSRSPQRVIAAGHHYPTQVRHVSGHAQTAGVRCGCGHCGGGSQCASGQCASGQCVGGQCGQRVPETTRRCLTGVDNTGRSAEARWTDVHPLDFGPNGPGEYAGPARSAHLDEYRLRPRDVIQVVYMISRRQESGAYRLTPGDEVLIESNDDKDITRGNLTAGLRIQPDGTITLRQIGQVYAAGLTIDQLRKVINREYAPLVRRPDIDVTPIRTNSLAEEIRAAVGGQGGFATQAINVTVMADGNIRLPGVGQVCVQGFTLSEMKREINLRFKERNIALDVEPILAAEAPHFVYVLGQVATPSQIQIDSPTTVLGAIASAGGINIGANMRQVVVFRRGEDWRLISTMLDLSGAVYAKRPAPTDEIWLRDGDVVIVPAKPIQLFDNFVRQVFTEGIYGIVPFGGINIDIADDGE